MSSYSGSNSDQLGYSYLFKLVLAGTSGVGKTSLLMRYTDDHFSETFISTIGVDFKIKTEEVCGVGVKLQMWDTAGQDRFKSVASNFYRCAEAIIIVFDVCDARSFREVENWVAEAKRYGPPECQGLLVGNKADDGGTGGTDTELGLDASRRQVAEAEARALADRLGMKYLETSAKTGHNVHKAFKELAEQLVTRRREENGGEDPLPDTISNNLGKKKGLVLDGSTKQPESNSYFYNICCSGS